MRKPVVHLFLIRKSSLIICFCIIVLIVQSVSFAFGKKETWSVYNNNYINYNIIMKRDLLCLMIAYWKNVKGILQTQDGKVYLVMQSGSRILYDDKKVKTPDEKFANADLQDMLEQIYPLFGANYLRSIDFNPGRNRTYKLFEDVYGKTKGKIEVNLVSVGYGNLVLKFNEKNNAANMLKKVNSELAVLTKIRSGLKPFIYPSSGTYNYRNISGTNLLSAHSFGTAIDLPANGKDYWQWASRNDGQKRMSAYPPEVVKIFEKNLFIWGGRWGYFDLMHYEYRPELILKARYFSKMPEPGQPWYIGSPYSEDIHIRNYIKMIDEALRPG